MGRPAQRPASQPSPSTSPSPVVQRLCAHERAAQRHEPTSQRTSDPGQRDSATAFWNLWDVGSLFLAFGKAGLAISHLLVTRQSTCPVALTDNAHNRRTSPKRRAPAEAVTRGPLRADGAPSSALWLAQGQAQGEKTPSLVPVNMWPESPHEGTGTVPKPHTGRGTHDGPALQPPQASRNANSAAHVCCEAKHLAALGPPLFIHHPPPPPYMEGSSSECSKAPSRRRLEGALFRGNWGPAHGTRTPERRSRRRAVGPSVSHFLE